MKDVNMRKDPETTTTPQMAIMEGTLMETKSADRLRSSSSRRRQRVTPLSPFTQKPYRINFSCKNAGRYFRATKKRVRWTFGFTSLSPKKAGKERRVRRGEEHEVELFWSRKTRKMRLFWNKRNISNLFPESNQSDKLEFAWETQSGRKLHVIALTDGMEGSDGQYDLRIDGTSFLELPNLSEMPAILASCMHESEERCPEATGTQLEEEKADANDFVSRHSFENDAADTLELRLTLGGLNGFSGDVVDELHSDLYSPVLESLRVNITECLPQAEELVSRAITSAFSMDGDSLSTDHSLFTTKSFSDNSLDTDPYQVETDILCGAYKWSRRHVYGRPEDVATDAALKYYQKLICTVFVAIRTEELTADAAARILLSLAALLNLKFANSIRRDTIILVGLPAGTTIDDLDAALGDYGEVESPGVASRDYSFGFCRFATEDAIPQLMNDVEDGFLEIKGERVEVLVMSEDVMEVEPLEPYVTVAEVDDDSEQIESDDYRPVSPMTIPHSLGPFAVGHLEDALRPPVFVTPDHARAEEVKTRQLHGFRSLSAYSI